MGISIHDFDTYAFTTALGNPSNGVLKAANELLEHTPITIKCAKNHRHIAELDKIQLLGNDILKLVYKCKNKKCQNTEVKTYIYVPNKESIIINE